MSAELTHSRCRRCGSWASVAADRCEFCGAVAPGGWRPEIAGHELRARHGGMALGGALGSVVMVLAVSQVVGHSGGAVWAAALWTWGLGTVGALAGLSVGALVGGWVDDEHLYPAGPRPVLQVQQRIAERQAALREALAHMSASRKRLSASVATADAEPAIAALEAARRATEAQLDRYAVEMWRIELLRWHNRLTPMESGWQRASHAQCEQWLVELNGAVSEGGSMLSHIAEDALSATPGGTRVVTRLREALSACEVLRQALLLRQAAALAEASPGISEAFHPASRIPSSLEALSQLAVRVEIGRILDVLPLLEEESVRIDAELAAIEEVGPIGELP